MNKTIPPLPQFNSTKRNETLAIIHGVYAGILSFSTVVFIYLEYQHQSADITILSIALIVILALIYFNIKACLKVKLGHGAGRNLSRVMAVFMLLSFPIGTVLGVIALWKTTNKQWEN